MAITVNNLQSASGTSSLSYTPSNVTDSVLVVFVVQEDVSNNDPISGITFGGVSMTIGASISQSGTNANDSFIAYLTNPGTTQQTIQVSGGEVSRIGIAAVTLGGVDQASPIDDSDAAAVPPSSPPHSVTTSVTTTAANSLVLTTCSFSVGSGSLSITGGSASILLDIKPGSTVDFGVASDTLVSASTQAYTWEHPSTAEGQRFSAATVAFKESGGGTIFDEAITLSISNAINNTASAILNNSISLSNSLSISQASSAVLNSAISLANANGITTSSGNIFNESVSLNNVIDQQQSSSAVFNDSVTFSFTNAQQQESIAVYESNLTLANSLLQQESTGNIFNEAVTLAASMGQTVAAEHVLEAALSLGFTKTQSQSSSAVLVGDVTLSTVQSQQQTSNASYNVSVSLASQHDISASGENVIEEALTLSHAVSLAVNSAAGGTDPATVQKIYNLKETTSYVIIEVKINNIIVS